MSTFGPGFTAADLAKINARNRARLIKRGNWSAPVEPPKPVGRPVEGEGFRARELAKRRNERRQAAKVGWPQSAPPVVPEAIRLADGLRLVLPYPPSVNHYWLLGQRGRRFISKAGVAFRLAVKSLPLLQTFAGEVAVKITACPPDRRRRDLDNLLKSLLDSIQHAGIIRDDVNVVDLHIVRGEIFKGGQVKVEIRAFGVPVAAQNAI